MIGVIKGARNDKKGSEYIQAVPTEIYRVVQTKELT